MIRKLLLPVLAAALLGGCATGYDYRGGNGDYYYGQPAVDYQDDSYGPYGYGGYGYPGGWSGMIGYGMGYGGGYGYGYGGYPYGYGYPYYPPVIIVRPDPPTSTTGPQRPGQRPPGNPDQSVPSSLHGRGHPWAPTMEAPVSQRQPALVPRFEPRPYPGEDRIQREPSRPMQREIRQSPRRERDDSLIPRP